MVRNGGARSVRIAAGIQTAEAVWIDVEGPGEEGPIPGARLKKEK